MKNYYHNCIGNGTARDSQWLSANALSKGTRETVYNKRSLPIGL